MTMTATYFVVAYGGLCDWADVALGCVGRTAQIC
jgi:hypothetical protein